MAERKTAPHPATVLFGAHRAPLALPVCDHYAGSLRFLEKALELRRAVGPALDITADLEDGAPVGEEAAHAQAVAAWLAGLPAADVAAGLRVGVRIHDPGHRAWHADVERLISVAGDRIAYFTLPKIGSVAEVERMTAAIDEVCRHHGVMREIPVQVLIETLDGLNAVEAIAELPRVDCLSFGLMDFVSGFGGAVPAAAMSSPLQFDHPLVREARVRIALAAHRHGKVAAHNVCTDVADPQAAGRDAARALSEFGCTRMWSIHPSQVAPIVAALAPDHAAVGQAARILAAARAAGWGPTRVDDRLHDRASYRYWWALLARARAAGVALPEGVPPEFFTESP